MTKEGYDVPMVKQMHEISRCLRQNQGTDWQERFSVLHHRDLGELLLHREVSSEMISGRMGLRFESWGCG